ERSRTKLGSRLRQGTQPGLGSAKSPEKWTSQREARDIAEGKKRLALLCADVSERGFERVEQLVGKGNLRDAAMCAGIAADKLVALTQSSPMVAVQINIEDIERRRTEARARRAELDAMERGEFPED